MPIPVTTTRRSAAMWRDVDDTKDRVCETIYVMLSVFVVDWLCIAVNVNKSEREREKRRELW